MLLINWLHGGFSINKLVSDLQLIHQILHHAELILILISLNETIPVKFSIKVQDLKLQWHRCLHRLLTLRYKMDPSKHLAQYVESMKYVLNIYL